MTLAPRADDDHVAGTGQVANHFPGGVDEHLIVDALYAGGRFTGQFMVGFRQRFDAHTQVVVAGNSGSLQHPAQQRRDPVAEPLHPLLFGNQVGNRRADNPGSLSEDHAVNVVQAQIAGDLLAHCNRTGADGSVNSNDGHRSNLPDLTPGGLILFALVLKVTNARTRPGQAQ